MISYLKRESPADPVSAVNEYTGGTWVNVVAPPSDELDYLASVLGAKRDLLQDALDVSEVPRAQEERGVWYVFVRVPHGDGDAITTVPALFALGPDFLLTLSGERLPFLERFFGGQVQFSTAYRSQLFLRLMSELVTVYQHSVTAMNKLLRHKLHNFGRIDSADVLQLIASEGVLNDFIGALVPMQAILHSVIAGKLMKMYDEDKDLIEDVHLAMGQVVEAARNQLRTTANYRESYSVIATNDLNRFVKIFTLMTVLIMIPNLITSFWGMNVALPIQHNPGAFYVIAGFTLAIVVVLGFIVWRKRLL